MKKNNLEHGQLLPILAIALIAILAVSALALDGTIVYSTRRNSQSTADSAAISAAGAAAQVVKDYPPSELICGGALAQAATAAAISGAQLSAAYDNITLSTNQDDPNHVYVTCGTSAFSYYLDVHVQVTSETTPGLGAVIRKDPIVSVVDAVSRVYPKQNIAFGNAIASLSHDCSDGGITLVGNSVVTINDGGVFSNSCLTGKGTIQLAVTGAGIRYIGDLIDTSQVGWSPAPQKAVDPLPDSYDVDVDCSGLTNYGSHTGDGTIQPGIYSSIKLNGGTLTMNQGLYCLDGDFSTSGNAILHGTNITIYMRSGSFDTTGTSETVLVAPNCETTLCGVPPAVRGMLLYVDPSNSSIVKFNGTPGNTFSGTIYAPSSEIQVGGTEDGVTIDTQVVGKSVTVNGKVNFTMDLDAANIYQNPSSLELLE